MIARASFRNASSLAISALIRADSSSVIRMVRMSCSALVSCWSWPTMPLRSWTLAVPLASPAMIFWNWASTFSLRDRSRAA